MSNYRHYFKRQYGLKESQLPPSIVEKNSFPGIDPDELAVGTGEEEKEHGMSPEKAKLTAMQHLKEPEQHHYYSGVENAKDKGMLKDMIKGNPSSTDRIISPTAINPPIIGVAIRGSSTGGLPSGADQGGNISPSNLGGYEPISIQTVNSKLVNKTPTNSQINSNNPIAPNMDTIIEPHPHQTQNDSGEPPQAVTGASTDSNPLLTLKSAMPKEIDVDVSEQEAGTEDASKPNKEYDELENDNTKKQFGTNLEEVFNRHKKLMQEKLGINLEENVGSKEPFNTKWKMDKNKAGMVKVNEDEKWMQKASNPSTKGALHKELGVPKNTKIPTERLESIKKSLHTKSKTPNGLSEKELKLSRRVNAALNMRNSNK